MVFVNICSWYYQSIQISLSPDEDVVIHIENVRENRLTEFQTIQLPQVSTHGFYCITAITAAANDNVEKILKMGEMCVSMRKCRKEIDFDNALWANYLVYNDPKGTCGMPMS